MKITSTGELAEKKAMKIIIYGGPGCGKTPAVTTASNVLYVAVEKGQRSLVGTNIPAVECYEPNKWQQFYNGLISGTAYQEYDTFFIDSISQVAENITKQQLPLHKHGQQAYGAMATIVLDQLDKMYELPNKNIILLAKEDKSHKQKTWPYFPGNEINTKLPHLFDGVFHMGLHDVPGKGMILSLQTQEDEEVFARSRYRELQKYEACKLDYLINKITVTKGE